jgi:hypothetical protein
MRRSHGACCVSMGQAPRWGATAVVTLVIAIAYWIFIAMHTGGGTGGGGGGY